MLHQFIFSLEKFLEKFSHTISSVPIKGGGLFFYLLVQIVELRLNLLNYSLYLSAKETCYEDLDNKQS